MCMPRPPRPLAPETVYHLTASCNNAGAVFLDDRDRREYLGLLERTSQAMDVDILVYVLMTTHIHLIVWTARANLSAFVQRLHGIYGGRFNRRHGRTGHVFKGRFYSKVIENDAYLLAASRYIHRNPVVAGLSETPSGYRWTSYSVYVERPTRSIVNPSRVLAAVSSDEGQARREYARFVESDRGLPGRQNSLQAVLADSLGCDLNSLLRSRRGSQVRAMALLWLRQTTGASPKSLGQAFGMSPSAVCNSLARLGRQLDNPLIVARLEQVKSVLASFRANLPV